MTNFDDPAMNDSRTCTRGFFAQVLSPVIAAVGRAIKSQNAKLRDELQAAIDDMREKAASAERRLSRHAEHLSRLESRMKSMEQK